jgi:hypothetical protein
MARVSDDLAGEAHLVDVMVPRHTRILDGGYGPGHVGGTPKAGHDVVGVDVDPVPVDSRRTGRRVA